MSNNFTKQNRVTKVFGYILSFLMLNGSIVLAGGEGEGGCPSDPISVSMLQGDVAPPICPTNEVILVVEGDQGDGEWVVFLGDVSGGEVMGRGNRDTVTTRLGLVDDTLYTVVGISGGCDTTNGVTLVIKSTDTLAPVPVVTSLPKVTGVDSVVVSTGGDIPLALDDCDESLRGDSPDIGVTLTTVGIHTVTWTYTDETGNVATQTQEFQVLQGAGPGSYWVNDTICEGESIMFGGESLTNEGVYTDTIAVTGGDSIVELTLSFYEQFDIDTVTIIESNAFVTVLRVDSVGYQSTYQWLDCADGYAIVEGQSGIAYTIPPFGEYAVEITHRCGIDTTACYVYSDISINELRRGAIVIAPNPVKDHIQLRFQDVAMGKQLYVNIYNGLGDQVMENIITINSNNVLDLRALESGVYSIEALDFNARTRYTQRFVKE